MRPEKRFHNKVAIVTGGSEGMGKAIAAGFASEGARVAVFARRPEVLKQAVEDIKASGGTVMGLSIDVSVSRQVRDGVEAVSKEFGPIDILVNNAGGATYMPFVETTEDMWDASIALNLKSNLICTRAVIAGMITRKYGRIVSVSSDAGRGGTGRGGLVYSACKGSVIALTKSLAMEVARYNIRVNCVAPGFVLTPALAVGFAGDPARLERGISSIPMHRPGKPEEIADAVLFLTSDEASYITGQTLSVNGGVIMVD